MMQWSSGRNEQDVSGRSLMFSVPCNPQDLEQASKCVRFRPFPLRVPSSTPVDKLFDVRLCTSVTILVEEPERPPYSPVRAEICPTTAIHAYDAGARPIPGRCRYIRGWGTRVPSVQAASCKPRWAVQRGGRGFVLASSPGTVCSKDFTDRRMRLKRLDRR